MKSPVSLRLSPVILTVVILLTLLFSPMVVQAAVSIQVIGGRSPQLADSPEGAQGGVSSGETVTIRAAEELVPMYNPAINHYRFAGWDTYPSGGAEIYDLADRKAMVTSFTANTDVTYMATFDVILKPGKPTITSAVGEKQSIHITFEPNAESHYPAPHQFRIFGDFGSYNVAGHERAFRIPNLKDEHTYQVHVEAIYDGVSGPSETVSITAGVMMFTIDFDSNGGTPVASQKVALGDLVSPPPSDPVREGHTFEGWFWTNSGTNQKFTFDLPIYANLTLKAEWKKVEVPPHPTPAPYPTPAPTPTPSPTPEPTPEPTPTPEPSETDTTETTNEGISISFDTAGGDSIPDISVDASGELTLPPDPVREGYTFLGWYENGHRFDPLKPLVVDFTLVAKWERAYPEDDLAYLIGEPGQLDGVLAKAIGVSGTYDPDTYRAELATPFPSIRLVSVNDAEYHVTFHSLPHGRLTDMAEAAIGRENARLFLIANRFASDSHFESFCFVDHLTALEGENKPPYGKEASQYSLRDLHHQVINVVDMIYGFKCSDSVISLNYPFGGEEFSYDMLVDVMKDVKIEEGDRPVIDFIRNDRRFAAWQELKINDIFETLVSVEDYLSEELSVPLNAELLSYVADTVKNDVSYLSSWYNLEAPELNDLLLEEKEKWMETNTVVDLIALDEKETYIRFDTWRYFAMYTNYLPEYYEPALSFVAENASQLEYDRVLDEPGLWADQMRLMTELATMVETRPAWTDPIFDSFKDRLVFAFSMYLNSTYDWLNETPDLSVIAGMDHYLDSIDNLEKTMPVGRFHDRIGYYSDIVREWKNSIEENNREFTSDDLLAYTDKVNVYNMPNADDIEDYAGHVDDLPGGSD